MDLVLKAVEYIDAIILSSWTTTFLQILLHLLFCVLNILQHISSSVITGSLHIALKLLGAALTELTLQLIVTYVYTRENDDSVITKEDDSKTAVAIQTSGPWQKKIRSKERVYTELLELFSKKISILKRRHRSLLSRGKFKVHSMEREYSGKKKLLSGVCHRLVNIGIEVDHLSHRIREKRHLLDNRRLQNQCVVERYEELNQQLNFYLNNVLQEPLHTEVVQPEMATT
ncbi:uncharacterized protein LOC111132324 [Crassostrea virginica]